MRAGTLDVLLVEDNPADARLLEEQLKNDCPEQVALTAVSNIKDALRRLDERTFDAVLLDLSLPDSHGLETVARILGHVPSVPIVVLTGLVDDELAVTAVHEGAQDYLVKGQADGYLVLRSIRYAIERHQLHIELEDTVEHLKISEARIRKIIDQNADAILLVDIDGTVHFVNPAAEILFDRNSDDFLGQKLDMPISQHGSTDFVITSGSEEIYVEFRVTETEWEGDQVFLVSLRDVTSRRLTEAALSESEEKYRSLFEESKDAIYISDPNGNIIDINQALSDLFGYDREELVANENAAHLLYTNPADRDRFQREIKKTGTVRDFGAVMKTKDGTELSCLETATVRLSENGEILGYQGIIRDITLQKQHEAELIRARKEAEEMSRLKSTILTNMSHEIRTPLTAIMGFSSILADDMAEESREMLGHIESNSQRLLNLLNSILNLSALEAEAVEMNLEIVNVVEEVRDDVALLSSLADEKGLDLNFESSKSEILANLDRPCLSGVVNNLVGNAIKFTERGHVLVSVETMNSDRVLIKVSDTGIGISKEFLPRLFDEYGQESTGTTRTHEGIGLGLSITKRLVELMGGKIDVQSEQGKGTSFSVSFPHHVLGQTGPVNPAKSTSNVR